jgi:phage terminase large subunit GpA-like protein
MVNVGGWASAGGLLLARDAEQLVESATAHLCPAAIRRSTRRLARPRLSGRARGEKVASARSREPANTVLSTELAGGILVMTGANPAVGLRSTPARHLLLDEVDAYPASADEEGAPVALAEARRSLRNGILGESCALHGETPDRQRLYERREPWPLGKCGLRGGRRCGSTGFKTGF